MYCKAKGCIRVVEPAYEFNGLCEDHYADAQPRGSDLAELRVGPVGRTLGHGTIEELGTGWSLEVA